MNAKFTGMRIMHLRERLGISRKELALAIEVNVSAVTYWELGAHVPRPDILDRLLQFFEVTDGQFYDDEFPDHLPKLRRKAAVAK